MEKREGKGLGGKKRGKERAGEEKDPHCFWTNRTLIGCMATCIMGENGVFCYMQRLFDGFQATHL